jgi:hypothetical protein
VSEAGDYAVLQAASRRASESVTAAAPAVSSQPMEAGAPVFTVLLFDVLVDPFDNANLAPVLPDVVNAMSPLLPAGWCH